MQLLQHLLDLPEDLEAYTPLVERGAAHNMVDPASERDNIKARARTTAVLLTHGLEAGITDDEDTEANKQFHKHLHQQPISPRTLENPAIILKLSALMSEYDYEVVRDANQMRAYVTNRLLEESSPDKPPTQRLQALKMLGQITEVGLFTERTEITVKAASTEALEARLHETLITLLPEEYSELSNA